MDNCCELEVFYDGACPLCVREIRMVRGMDGSERIEFTDISRRDFDPSALGTTYEVLMAKIHAKLPDGTWIVGVDVFRHIYDRVGFGWLVRLSRLPLIRNIVEWGYEVFAKNRLSWTGRCEGDSCEIPAQRSEPLDVA